MSNDNPTNNKPTHEHFIVDGAGEKAYWHKIGVAWMNEDGVLSNKFYAAPLNGEFVTLPVGYKKK